MLKFPRPENLKELRRFLDLTRRFHSKLCQGCPRLTTKDITFNWSDDCKTAFVLLKNKLVTPPVLAYPGILHLRQMHLSKGLVLYCPCYKMMESSIQLLMLAELSAQVNASRYSVTELETLAVVWSVSQFHAYLYGHKVTIRTDHSAVKAILETSSPIGKHACWWTRVYGRGIEEVISLVVRALGVLETLHQIKGKPR